MANAKIFQERNLILDFVVQKDKNITKINDVDRLVSVSDLSPNSKNFKETNYSNSVISSIDYRSIVKEQLPFRVRFINKGFSAYGPDNPPPIGVAVIGFNNYIL